MAASPLSHLPASFWEQTGNKLDGSTVDAIKCRSRTLSQLASCPENDPALAQYTAALHAVESSANPAHQSFLITLATCDVHCALAPEASPTSLARGIAACQVGLFQNTFTPSENLSVITDQTLPPALRTAFLPFIASQFSALELFDSEICSLLTNPETPDEVVCGVCGLFNSLSLDEERPFTPRFLTSAVYRWGQLRISMQSFQVLPTLIQVICSGNAPGAASLLCSLVRQRVTKITALVAGHSICMLTRCAPWGNTDFAEPVATAILRLMDYNMCETHGELIAALEEIAGDCII